ncbi:MAG: hypothetical protein U5K43_13245 [Halofilum sp. (in: g-proteobacteria)]|nr:hypothetical protein [Halofilum sp. (in: g-proteobacteria)]
MPLAVPDDLGGLALDDSGAPLTPPAERTPPQIDTGGLALSDDEAPAGRERDRAPPDIDTGDLELEPGPGEGG